MGFRMRRYEVKICTNATTVVVVDASDEDEACDMAIDFINDDDITFDGDWDIVDVCEIDPRD
jgi:hypothetical protein